MRVCSVPNALIMPPLRAPTKPALRAATLSKGGGRPVLGRLGFLGDSIMQSNHSFPGSGGYAQTLGLEVAWAHAYWPYFDIATWYDAAVSTIYFTGMNGGILGNTSANVLARVEPMRRRRPGVLLLSVGTNDVGNSVAAATTMANIQAICDYFLSFGSKIILSTVRPRGSASYPDGDARITLALDLNDLIRTYAAITSGVTLWDVYNVYNDGAGRPISGYIGADGIHPGRTGGQVAGRDLASVIATVMGAGVSDIPTGTSLASNDVMSGTGGGKLTRVTGSTADAWSLGASGTGTATAVASKDGNGKQVLTVSPQAAGQSSETFLLTRAVGGVTVTPGTWIRTYTKLKLSAWDGWRGIYHTATPGSGGLAAPGTTEVMDVPTEQTFYLIGPAWLVTAGTTSVPLIFRVGIDGTKTGGSGVLTVEQHGIYVVDDPRLSHGG